jgi:uncharacterized membrane-anchored protein
VTVAVVLSALWCLARPPVTPAASAQGEAIPEVAQPEDLVEADPEAEVDPKAEVDPEIQALLEAALAKLDPAARAAFEALDDQGRKELFEKAGRGSPLAPEEQAIVEAFARAAAEQLEAGLRYQTGDVEIADGLAVLHLGEGFRYLDPEQADRILVDAWGNPRGEPTLGMILPADVSPLDPEQGWGVVVTYAADGYVEDDDADDIDYDELLEQMQADVEAANPGRRSQGYPPIRLVGWAEPPHYDEATHRLYWAKELEFGGEPEHTLNYAIRVLGRRGVLELNAVAPLRQLPRIEPQMEDVLSRVEFVAGHRYEDFDPDLDEVAAYGIGGLIAGKMLAKAGILAGLLKILLAAKKLLVLGAIAAAVVLKRWLGRKDAA